MKLTKRDLQEIDAAVEEMVAGKRMKEVTKAVWKKYDFAWGKILEKKKGKEKAAKKEFTRYLNHVRWGLKIGFESISEKAMKAIEENDRKVKLYISQSDIDSMLHTGKKDPDYIDMSDD